jgi:short subunit dehydrogenase-like uncharacterized protein
LIAGRKEWEIRPLAQQYDLKYEVIALEDTEKLIQLVSSVQLVIHAAGPFIITARPMAEACLKAGTHYIDITGEIQVFEYLKSLDAQARDKGIMLMPGTGFDVVPTDCLSLYLKKILPDAQHLQLAFASIGSTVSHGTATTMSFNLGEKGATRINGRIIPEPIGKHGKWIDFGRKFRFAVSIPWGDISTAYSTTGIPHIQTFMAVGKSTYLLLKFQFLFNWILRMNITRRWMRKKINQRPSGPNIKQRTQGYSLVWGEVRNSKGEKRNARLQCPEGYALTAYTAALIADKIMGGNFKQGYQTPAAAYGEDLILEVPGTVREDVPR